MPFGTRRRVRQSFQFFDPVLPARINEGKKLLEIAKQGLENTSQREEPRPSAKAFIQPIFQDDKVERINRVVKGAQPLVSSTIKKAQGFIKKSNVEQSGESKFKKISIHNPNQVLKSIPRPAFDFELPKGHELTPPKLSALEDKLLKRLESGDANLTEAEFEIIGKLQNRVDKEPTRPKQSPEQAKVLQLIANKVKGNIKQLDKKIKGSIRSQVQKEIRLKEIQLKKLKNLLSKCPTCS